MTPPEIPSPSAGSERSARSTSFVGSAGGIGPKMDDEPEDVDAALQRRTVMESTVFMMPPGGAGGPLSPGPTGSMMVTPSGSMRGRPAPAHSPEASKHRMPAPSGAFFPVAGRTRADTTGSDLSAVLADLEDGVGTVQVH
jgi:hypothetical protein